LFFHPPALLPTFIYTYTLLHQATYFGYSHFAMYMWSASSIQYACLDMLSYLKHAINICIST
jgi:hypothetical protein